MEPKNYHICFHPAAMISHQISLYHACILSMVHQTSDATGWSAISNSEIKQTLGLEKSKVFSLLGNLYERDMLRSNGLSNQKRRLCVTESGISAIRITDSDVDTDTSAIRITDSDVDTDTSAIRITDSDDQKPEKIAVIAPDITLVISEYRDLVSKEDTSTSIYTSTSSILEIGAKKQKNKKLNKYPDGYFERCKTRYTEWRASHNLQEEYFTAKEAGSLRNLLNALKFTTTPRSADATEVEDVTTDYEALYESFCCFLDKMPNRYIEMGAGLAVLYSSYNTIVAMQNEDAGLRNADAIVAAFREKIKTLSADYVVTEAERKAAKELMGLLLESAKQKWPDQAPPTNEKAVEWAQHLFSCINTLDWWAPRTSSIGFVVRNYNAIKQALSPSAAAAAKQNGKKQPTYGTHTGWANKKAAEIFNHNHQNIIATTS